jgi:predicted nucleic acid-binding protein
VRPRIHPVDAARIVRENILAHLEAIPLSKADYLEALTAMEDGGQVGAKIYDVLLLRCAAIQDVERIYTSNRGDFRELAPASLRGKICAP